MNSTPMDIFSSDLAIPFELAAFCRGHKLCIQTVNLARAIKAKEAAWANVKAADSAMAEAQEALDSAMVDVRTKMDKGPV